MDGYFYFDLKNINVLDKLNNIIRGWKGYIWETNESKSLALKRAVVCDGCEFAEWGLIPQFMDDEVKQIKGLQCAKCSCPLSTLLRSPDSKCEEGKW